MRAPTASGHSKLFHASIGQGTASLLKELKDQGAKIRLVQVYTVARPSAYGIVSSLSNKQVNEIEQRVHRETGLPISAFYGNIPEGSGLLGVQPD